jgi:hypothetical protein
MMLLFIYEMTATTKQVAKKVEKTIPRGAKACSDEQVMPELKTPAPDDKIVFPQPANSFGASAMGPAQLSSIPAR